MYTYRFSPYIFGRTQPGGVADNIQLSADVTTIGLLQTAFTVNPLRPGQSTWWDQTYNVPDVALNHPSRWQLTKPGLTNPIPNNCLAWDGSSQMDCLSKGDENPADPWTSSFHHMRGPFISKAGNPNQGPQLSLAQAGDQLALTTRVYNYSLADMSGDTEVHVRFYGQPWKTGVTGGPSNVPDGNSSLIGENKLGPIPGFDPSAGAPLNWVFTTVNFDTTPYSDKYLTFFVLVWMQKSDGTLVAEMPHHGLDNLFNQNAPVNSFADAASFGEDYTNNIGFYNSAIYVASKSAAPARRAAASAGAPTLRMAEVVTPSRVVKLGERIEISTALHAGDQSLVGLSVNFYDGDPAAGGKIFDSERIPFIRAGEGYGLRVRYTVNHCGTRPIFVQAAGGRPYAVSGQSRPVQVECPPAECAAMACLRSPQYYALNLDRLPRGLVTVAGGGVSGAVNTEDAARMRLLLQGGTAAQQQFNRQFVAAQLSLLALPGLGQAALRSNLSCYQVGFQPTQLGTGETLSPEMTLGELFDLARRAARSGSAADQRMLGNLFERLNGSDPGGGCGR